nr:VENN motif pre-toxin domain-containing protein [Moraxella sp. Tifton1]
MYAPNSNGIIGDVARAASPEFAYRIGQEFKENKILNQTDNGSRPEEQSLQHLLAHAILGGATSYATGNDITTGTISAVSNEAGAKILANYLYQGKDPEKLTQEQKDTIVSILSLTTATTIYTATDGSTTDAVSGAEIGKVGVEWNGATDRMDGTDATDRALQRQAEALYPNNKKAQQEYIAGRMLGFGNSIATMATDTANAVIHPVDTATNAFKGLVKAISSPIATAQQQMQAVQKWQQDYKNALKSNPKLAGQMYGELEGAVGANIATTVVGGTGANAVKALHKTEKFVASKPNMFEI